MKIKPTLLKSIALMACLSPAYAYSDNNTRHAETSFDIQYKREVTQYMIDLKKYNKQKQAILKETNNKITDEYKNKVKNIKSNHHQKTEALKNKIKGIERKDKLRVIKDMDSTKRPSEQHNEKIKLVMKHRSLKYDLILAETVSPFYSFTANKNML